MFVMPMACTIMCYGLLIFSSGTMVTTVFAMVRLAGASRMQRVLTGLAVLLFVDVLWVATPEVTKVCGHGHT
jgi:hypothetical protein